MVINMFINIFMGVFRNLFVNACRKIVSCEPFLGALGTLGTVSTIEADYFKYVIERVLSHSHCRPRVLGGVANLGDVSRFSFQKSCTWSL